MEHLMIAETEHNDLGSCPVDLIDPPAGQSDGEPVARSKGGHPRGVLSSARRNRTSAKTQKYYVFTGWIHGEAVRIVGKYRSYRNDEILTAALLALEVLPDQTRALVLQEAVNEVRRNLNRGVADIELPLVSGIKDQISGSDRVPAAIAG